MSKDDELVLCLNDTVPFTGVVSAGLYEIDPAYLTFKRRGDVETDPSKRQVIPYLVITNSQKKVLVYKRGRKGNEERLHDLYAFGVGGHINPDDCLKDYDIVTNAMLREINEEIGLGEEDFVGCLHFAWIALGDTPVNQVHLGQVFILAINEDSIAKIKCEPGSIEEFSFKDVDELGALNLEGWSAALLPELRELLK